MGVDYEKCDECKGIYPDCGDNYPRMAEIDGEERRICSSCLKDVTSDMDQNLDDVDCLHGLLFYLYGAEEDKEEEEEDKVQFYHESDLYTGRAKMIELSRDFATSVGSTWTEFGFLICDDTIMEQTAIDRLDEDFDDTDDDTAEADETDQQKAVRIQKNLRWAWEHTCNNAKTVRMLQKEKIATYDAELKRYNRAYDKWYEDDCPIGRRPVDRPEHPRRMCVPEDCVCEWLDTDSDVEEATQEAINEYVEWLRDNDMLGDTPVYVSRDQKKFKADRIATLKQEVAERVGCCKESSIC